MQCFDAAGFSFMGSQDHLSSLVKFCLPGSLGPRPGQPSGASPFSVLSSLTSNSAAEAKDMGGKSAIPVVLWDSLCVTNGEGFLPRASCSVGC